MTFIDEFLLHLADLDRAAATTQTYEGVLRRMDRDLGGLQDSCADEIKAWINGGARSKGTRATYRAAVNSFFTWACNPADPRLDFNPMGLVPTVKVQRRTRPPAPEPELADILARAARPYRDWFVLASFGGLRCTEIAQLDRGDVTEESMRLLGKGDKERVVPTHPVAWAAVLDLPPGPVARNAIGGRATRQEISWRGNRYLHKSLGYPQITMHAFRRRFGTKVYEASGYDVRLVQELLGHSSPATTALYVAVAAPARARAVRRLGEVA